MFKELEDGFAVSPQLTADDVRSAASLGYETIVSNRPDGEAPDQPPAGEIEAAAQGEGLSFLHVPVVGGAITDHDVDEMAAALDAPGKVLAYCRTGTRSTALWAMARARQGQSPDALIAKASEAGYDLSGLRDRLTRG